MNNLYISRLKLILDNKLIKLIIHYFYLFIHYEGLLRCYLQVLSRKEMKNRENR